MRLIASLLLALCLASCGGGGGGSTTPLAKTTFAASELTPDCSGTNCAAASVSSNTYSGSGTAVWRYNNTSEEATVGDINIQNVPAGKKVTLLFSNGQDTIMTPTVPTFGVLAAPSVQPSPLVSASKAELADESNAHRAGHGGMLEKNRLVIQDLKSGPAQTTPAATAASRVTTEGLGGQPRPAALGDARVWNENAFDKINYSTTAKVVCPAGATGRKVVIWAQTSAYTPTSTISGKITDVKLAGYQSAFCGTANNGQYAKIAGLLGDVWGAVPSKYANVQIADTASQKQDLNIVIVAPTNLSNGWGGYFYGLNNGLKTKSAAYATSNEALVFFINAYQSLNYTNSVLIHELTHMINFYQRFILHDDSHETWLEETSAMMTQDIFDPGLALSSGCIPTVCDLQSYAISGAGIDYFNWPSATISNAHYYLGASFGSFLNRRFGPAIAVQLMTDCYTPTTNTTSLACLDFLIMQNGGISFSDEFSRMGASVFGLIGGTGEPSKYGYPAKSGVLAPTGNMTTSFAYSLPAFNNWWISALAPANLPTATPLVGGFTGTTHNYKTDTIAAGKTSYVRTGVSVPAKTTLITIIK
jgi:hypothetical protein